MKILYIIITTILGLGILLFSGRAIVLLVRTLYKQENLNIYQRGQKLLSYKFVLPLIILLTVIFVFFVIEKSFINQASFYIFLFLNVLFIVRFFQLFIQEIGLRFTNSSETNAKDKQVAVKLQENKKRDLIDDVSDSKFSLGNNVNFHANTQVNQGDIVKATQNNQTQDQITEQTPSAVANDLRRALINELNELKDKLAAVQTEIQKVKIDRSATSLAFMNFCNAYEIHAFQLNGEVIPRTEERLEFTYLLYKRARYVTLALIVLIAIYLSIIIFNLYWLLALVYIGVCLFLADSLLPTLFHLVFKVDPANPGSRRVAEYALIMMGLLAFVNLIGYYIGRSEEGSLSLLAKNHLTMLALEQVFLIIIAALLKLLTYYYGWSHRLASKYKILTRKLRGLETIEYKLIFQREELEQQTQRNLEKHKSAPPVE